MSELFTLSQVKTLFPRRDINSNKGDYGYVTLIGGCLKYSGAVRLAALANSAMRSGAGVCTIATPQSLAQIVLPQILESTYYALSDDNGDMVFSISEFDSLMYRSDVIAFGMGIGNTEETKKALQYLLAKYDGILVVDADGINAMAQMDKKEIVKRKCKLVLTPHPKEFARLAGVDTESVTRNPEESARKLASQLKATVLLKGHVTYVSNGALSYRVEKGCAGMATAGSGDVLAGILAAVLGSHQKNILAATAAAAYINGLAGEIAAQKHGETSMLAGDTAACVEEAIQKIVHATEEEIKTSEKTSEATAAVELNASAAQHSEKTKKQRKKKEAAPKSVAVEQPKEEAKEEKAQKPKSKAGRIIFNIFFTLVLIAAMGRTVEYAGNEIRAELLAAEIAATPVDTRTVQEDYSIAMEFVKKDIYIDGIHVNNYQTYRPMFRINGELYVPLNGLYCDALGIEALFNSDELKDIVIKPASANHQGVYEENLAWNLYDAEGTAKGNINITIPGQLTEEEIEQGVTVNWLFGTSFIVDAKAPEEVLFPDASEVVVYDSTVYIPLYMLENSDILCLSYFEDDTGGIYISTDAEIPAENYYSENNAAFINGRAEYIKTCQPDLPIEECREYEYYFRHEATVRDVPEDLMMALAKAESDFNKDEYSSAGARGMMQAMPGTARSQGYDPETLFDAHTSIEFGTLYMYYVIGNFDGDYVKALSCYLYGGAAVLAGKYSTGYANSVLKFQENMEQWITDNGYSNEFYTVLECTK